MDVVDLKISEIEKLTGAENKYWICGHVVGEFLYKQIVEISAKTVLEFGTSVGYSALWMAKALKPIGGRLLTVESHKERGDLAAKHFEEAGVMDVISLVRGHAPEVLMQKDVFKDTMFDMAFFDATKYEHLSYFDFVYPRLKKGGVLVVDNVISHGDGNMMRKFLDLVAQHPVIASEIIDIGSGILIGRKQ